MGLGIEVGYLQDMLGNDAEGAEWFRSALKTLNEVLSSEGLGAHDEPESLPCGVISSGFPYSFLHYLRRAYACLAQDLPIRTGELTVADESLAADEASMLSSHLLVHSDAEGYYVPIDFADPVFHDDLPGCMLGSSQRLLAELLELAEPLGMTTPPSNEAVASWASLGDDDPLFHERFVWAALYRAAQASVEHKALIVFC
jgi:hypothetical protein